jgi:hypothetical protein
MTIPPDRLVSSAVGAPAVMVARENNVTEPAAVSPSTARPATVPPTIKLLRQLSWTVEKLVKSEGDLRCMLWATEDGAGQRVQFETKFTGPTEVGDDELLAALCDDLRADFARDGVVRFALAFPGDVLDFAAGPFRDPVQDRREVVALEAHNHEGVHIGAHRLMLRTRGRPPVLGKLSPLEQLHRSRYLALVQCAANGQ